jgi:hypothetical protein
MPPYVELVRVFRVSSPWTCWAKCSRPPRARSMSACKPRSPICGQSVLAVATLAVQAHANIALPTGQSKPLSSYFISVAATGERKSAVDHEALWSVRQRETALRNVYVSERLDYQNQLEAWEAARKSAIKGAKGDRVRIKAALDATFAFTVARLRYTWNPNSGNSSAWLRWNVGLRSANCWPRHNGARREALRGLGSANDPKGVQTWRPGSARALSWTLEGGCGA